MSGSGADDDSMQGELLVISGPYRIRQTWMADLAIAPMQQESSAGAIFDALDALGK
jgi:hypothetical protein